MGANGPEPGAPRQARTGVRRRPATPLRVGVVLGATPAPRRAPARARGRRPVPRPDVAADARFGQPPPAPGLTISGRRSSVIAAPGGHFAFGSARICTSWTTRRVPCECSHVATALAPPLRRPTSAGGAATPAGPAPGAARPQGGAG